MDSENLFNESSPGTSINLTDSAAVSSLLLPQDAQSEFSGFSNFNYEDHICDRLNGVFYHMFSTTNTVTVQFYVPRIFDDFVKLINHEFIGQCGDSNTPKLTLTQHVQGRGVCISVDKPEKKVAVTGPGHKLWKDITFKRIASNLLNSFVHEFSICVGDGDTHVSVHTTSTPVANVQEPVPAQTDNAGQQTKPPTEPPTETVVCSSQPVAHQISVILEMMAIHYRHINSLQSQLTDLTTEVIKLQQTCSVKDTDPSQVDIANTYLNVSDATTEPPTPNRITENNRVVTPPRDLSHNFRATSTPSVPQQPQAAGGLTAAEHTTDNGTKTKKTRFEIMKDKKRSDHPQTPTPAKKTLIIGDSILKGINEKGLNDNVYCHGISGATMSWTR